MTRATTLIALVVSVAVTTGATGCNGNGTQKPPPDPGPGFTECGAKDPAWVRSTYLAVLGHRPRSQAEVQVYVDLLEATRALIGTSAGSAAGLENERDARRVVARAMSEQPSFDSRWGQYLMDALKVARIEVQSQQECYGRTLREPDSGDLAAWVRDHAGTEHRGDGNGPFSMRDLLRSAVKLDDLSPLYRAHLFAMVSRPIPAANVNPVDAELARREDFGLQFESAYLNRDLVCLGCHNSEGSVTYSTDPKYNRHWALRGNVETALFGEATGIDQRRAHAPFRFDGVVANPFEGQVGEHTPWEWDLGCGSFLGGELEADPASVEGFFATLAGSRLSVYDLEKSLKRGFESLAAHGLVVAPDGTVADRNAAFAYLVSASIAGGVWTEIVGSPLTIANYFPRNRASRDMLRLLTEAFIDNNFSLKAVVAEVVSSPYFAMQAPEAGCGSSAYNMPPIYDPWTLEEEDETLKSNGVGDSVVPLSPRVLMRSAYEALDWDRPPFFDFPEQEREIALCTANFDCEEQLFICEEQGFCCEAHIVNCVNPAPDNIPTAPQSRAFQRGIGAFLKNGEPGFRGLDFQARLIFEDRFGACTNAGMERPDFITRLLARARRDDLPLREVIVAMKDRFIGEPTISEMSSAAGRSERSAIETLFGATLDSPVRKVQNAERATRAFCGVVLLSPQFLLTGLASPDLAPTPILTPEEAEYGAVCAALAEQELPLGLALSCDRRALRVAPTR